MSEAKDTLFRYLTVLQLIPRMPGRISTPSLQEKLKDRGFEISARSLQRDLRDKLSIPFSIICHEDERPYRWSLDAKAHTKLDGLDPSSALALSLAEGHLTRLLPQSVMAQLAPQFRAATHYLMSMEKNGLAQWQRRVRTIPNGKALLPAEISHSVWESVSCALVEQRRLRIRYLSRSKGNTKTLVLHPTGLVSRHSVNYLVACVDGYEEQRHFALHRIQTAEVLDEHSLQRPDFDMDRYIESGAFSFRQSPEEVELVADIHPQIAWLLNETPLSREQEIVPLADSDWRRLRARVPLDQETLWWLFGLNDQIRVYAPAVWVAEFASKTKQLHHWYATNATSPVASLPDTVLSDHPQT